MVENTQRRLVAIVSADVVGYSRLMGADEIGTLAALRSHRSELWIPTIQRFGGRIVGTAGDAILVEFVSIVAAVESAVVVQQEMNARNAVLPEKNRMLLRIGINVGEVIVEDDDIYGDGVNIAARIQALCDPGGIALSDDGYRQVRDRLDMNWKDGGKHQVKNIVRPVHIWRWSTSSGRQRKNTDIGIPTMPPDKPSIAVLAFENMSGDKEQEFFADGMAEDIITGLSKFSSLHVVARNSSFTFKGKITSAREIGEALGVRYVLEGSVRKSGNRVRITGQLIDAETGTHVWAERYDRELGDIFDVQDEITGNIVVATDLEVLTAEVERSARKPPENLAAWELYQRGQTAYQQATIDSILQSRELQKRAIQKDPQFSQAYSALAWTYVGEVTLTGSDAAAAQLYDGLESAKKALALDADNVDALTVQGRILGLLGEFDLSTSSLQRAVLLNPNAAFAHFNLGQSFYLLDQPAEAIKHYDHALRLSPRDPIAWGIQSAKSVCLSRLEQGEEAIAVAQLAMRDGQNQFWPYVALAIAYVTTDDIEKARANLLQAKRLAPNLTQKFLRGTLMRAENSLKDNIMAKLERAGLPES